MYNWYPTVQSNSAYQEPSQPFQSPYNNTQYTTYYPQQEAYYHQPQYQYYSNYQAEQQPVYPYYSSQHESFPAQISENNQVDEEKEDTKQLVEEEAENHLEAEAFGKPTAKQSPYQYNDYYYLHLLKQVSQQVKDLHEKLEKVEKEKEELKEKVEQIKPINIENINYKIQELTVEELSGNLMIGMTALGELDDLKKFLNEDGKIQFNDIDTENFEQQMEDLEFGNEG
ncbi:hypothetical protein N0O92_13425 [Alkalihalobacillus sp. MEB130]|uniref:spore germination protein GerPC n=1 Tax=Alkalihalobacillus sp. MEB130 TaxID=2976704 RepID=UPI0028DE1446|nr:spore germination protein GerPC [Alkalihalobacillus sp. MEB130]MDT8861237.1 hypothetical protein [Alkalihalobacillus sp. MEB130]